MNKPIDSLIISTPVDTEIEEMLDVRVLAAVKAYSTPKGPDIGKHYSAQNIDIAKDIRSNKLKSLCAKIGNHVVGMCVWNDVGDNTVIIEYLYVDPKLQSNGIGGLLLEKVLKIIKDKNTVHLTTQSAQKFYETRGFVRTGIYTDDGITTEEEMVMPAKQSVSD